MSRILYDGEKLIVDTYRLSDEAVKYVYSLFWKYEKFGSAEWLPAIDGMSFNKSTQIVKELMAIEGAIWSPEFEALVNKIKNIEERKVQKAVEEQERVLKEADKLGIPSNLYPFQKEAVYKMLNSERNTMLASDPGCGKTCMSITYLDKKENSLPCLVVCPASLKVNWQMEFKKWAPEISTYIVSGRSSYNNSEVVALAKKADVVIINYDILGEDDKEASKKEKERIALAKEKGWRYKKAFVPTKGWVEVFDDFKFKTIICDECQYIESSKAIRSRAVIQVCKDQRSKKLFLSGTPFETKVKQFYNACHILAPDLFPDESGYLFRYCNPQRNYFGWTFDGVSNLEELRNKLSLFMIRHKKEDVLKQLPKKQRITIYFDMSESQRKSYDEMEEELLNQKEGVNQLSFLSKMKSALVDIKAEAVIQYIKDMLEVEDKLVVFTYHNDMFDILMNKFKGQCVGINGSTPTLERQPQVNKFQNDDKIKLFIGQIQAASTGLTLTASHTVIFTEFGNTIAQHLQGEDRVHRIGQESDRCIAYYLVTKDTIEESQAACIERHHKDIEAVMNGNTEAQLFDMNTAVIAKVKERVLMRKKKGVTIEYE